MYIVLIAITSLIHGAFGHGMVLDPPNRSSMWRYFPGFPQNYDDDGINCGGIPVQWTTNGGRCGVCGDDFRASVPRDNENTGKYGLGKVGKTYEQGSIIDVTVHLKANKRGYFNFSMCEMHDMTKPDTEDCFKLLKLADGGDKYVLTSTERGNYTVSVKLPDGKTCEHCVLRWHWNTGNNWGQCDDGSWATGCGPQETYKTCSDIAIV